MPYFSNPLPWALDILITDSFSCLNNKADKEMIQLEWFYFVAITLIHFQPKLNYSKKFKIPQWQQWQKHHLKNNLLTPRSLKHQNDYPD